MRTIFIVIMTYFSLNVAFAASAGKIQGKVIDSKTKETIVGCAVMVQGTTIGAVTDIDGNYIIESISPGTYNLVISYLAYDNQIVRTEIKPGEVVNINIELIPLEVSLNEVVVKETRRTSSDISMISSIKSSQLVVNGISREQITKSQDKDAADVIKRVPGITINDGRFVIVRGLIERYNSVLLNGASAPSFEADIRAFSFDAIPSGMINKITIFKSPAPELPADFAGAVINIETLNDIDDNSLKISYSTSYNVGTTFNKFYTYKGGKYDMLGFDDGTRSLPSNLPSTAQMTELYNWSNLESAKLKFEEINKISRSFNNIWQANSTTALPDQNLSINLTCRFTVKSVSFGCISSLNYGVSNSFYDVKRAEYLSYNAANDSAIYQFNFQDKKYNQAVKVGLINNWSMIYGKNQKLEFRNFFNQTGNKRVNLREGENYYNNDILRASELKYNNRFIYSSQLAGTNFLFDNSTKMTWILGYSSIKNSEPDTRRLTYIQNNDVESENYGKYYVQLQNQVNPYLAGRLNIDLNEKIYNAGANVEQKIFDLGEASSIVLKAGFFYENKKRNFNSRLLGITNRNNNIDLYAPVDSIFSSSNFELTLPLNQSKLAYNENTRSSDSYIAENETFSYYAGLQLPFRKFNLYGGVRMEKFHRSLNNRNVQSTGSDALNVKMDVYDIFPSINISYNTSSKQLLRLSYGKTVNRPEFREMSNFTYQNFEMFYLVHGNENLTNSYIDNFDLRYEIYPSNYENISLAAFYKKFEDPIEIFLVPAGTGYDYKPFNTAEAHSYGVELEVRKSLRSFENSSSILSKLKDFSLVLNASAIQSQIKTDTVEQNFAGSKNRIMQGQSPYILNCALYYENAKSKIIASLVYNVIGKRIAYVGTRDNPDTWEMPRNSLDFTVSKAIFSKVDIKFGVKDILNQPVQLVQFFGETNKMLETYSYRPGRKIAFSVSYKF